MSAMDAQAFYGSSESRRWEKPTVKVCGPGTLPKRQHDGDAGFDLAYYEPAISYIELLPERTAVLPTGLDVQCPDGYWLWVTGRSSMIGRGLICPGHVIDSGYRGPLFVTLYNQGEAARIRPGDRIAQMIVMERHDVGIVKVDELDPGERGANGFGSTGR